MKHLKTPLKYENFSKQRQKGAHHTSSHNHFPATSRRMRTLRPKSPSDTVHPGRTHVRQQPRHKSKTTRAQPEEATHATMHRERDGCRAHVKDASLPSVDGMLPESWKLLYNCKDLPVQYTKLNQMTATDCARRQPSQLRK